MDNKKITKNAYNAIAKKYYDVYKDDTSDFLYIDKLLKFCNNKILDLGCGMGHYSKYINKKGFEVVGVEFSKSMLEIAKENTKNIKYVESDICDLPQDLDKDFDGVLIAYVIQHLSYEETKECLLKLHKFIVPNAHILLLFREGDSILNEKEPFDNSFTYIIKEYTSEEITKLLNECGYEVLEINKKAFVQDDNSLCPDTLVVFAKNNN